jgi:predicted anti-sigma-YlaC factor YlaD
VDDLGPRRDGSSAVDYSVIAEEVTCRQFVELITDYFEGALTSRTLSHVEEHLVMCDWCATYLEQMETTVALLGELRDSSAPEPPEGALSILSARRDGGR